MIITHGEVGWDQTAADEHGDEYKVGHHGTARHSAAAERVAAHTGQQQRKRRAYKRNKNGIFVRCPDVIVLKDVFVRFKIDGFGIKQQVAKDRKLHLLLQKKSMERPI